MEDFWRLDGYGFTGVYCATKNGETIVDVSIIAEMPPIPGKPDCDVFLIRYNQNSNAIGYSDCPIFKEEAWCWIKTLAPCMDLYPNFYVISDPHEVAIRQEFLDKYF